MTPQLLQAIRLLQFSHVELSAFVQEELDRNPLLERAEETAQDDRVPAIDDFNDASNNEAARADADWPSERLATDANTLAGDLGTEVDNAFDTGTPATAAPVRDDQGLSATSWSGAPAGGTPDGETPNLEAYVAARETLHDYLAAQLAIACPEGLDRMIGQAVIDGIDEAGYWREPLPEVASRLGISENRIESVLATIQTFEPSGVGARDLAECLAIQLREQNRLDPAMAMLIANLPLLARREFPALRRLCGVDEDDLVDMVAEIRRLDPKPGRAFGNDPIQPVVPDVIVRPAADGSWHVELNSEVLPRVLVNQSFATTVRGGTDEDRSFIANCLQNANWLTKSLEQRARTILKVGSEIVRQQDGFFVHGVQHLRPLNLRAIADAIGMHESTVSRVTSNKYMSTPRGLFEMKFFFSAAISAQYGGEAHSAEAVRHRIKQLIDGEAAENVLSDDAIVGRLREANIDIARRTVAKYRESLKIPSSVERRREKVAFSRIAPEETRMQPASFVSARR